MHHSSSQAPTQYSLHTSPLQGTSRLGGEDAGGSKRAAADNSAHGPVLVHPDDVVRRLRAYVEMESRCDSVSSPGNSNSMPEHSVPALLYGRHLRLSAGTQPPSMPCLRAHATDCARPVAGITSFLSLARPLQSQCLNTALAALNALPIT